jgi:lipoprotein-anchoring transpeptidase ErfK/SrfK
MVRRRIALSCAIFCALVAAVPAIAQQPERRVAPGVSAGGVDLSNLTLAEATAKLDATLGPVLTSDVVVGAAGRPFALKAADAKVRFDSLRTAKRALYAKAPAQPSGGGAVVGTTVPLAISHAHLVVGKFADRVARSVYKAPRDATLRITLRRMYVKRARYGHAIDAAALAAEIDAALDNPALGRKLHEKLGKVRPKVNANDLRRNNGTVVTVDKANFKLRLFKQLKFFKSYGVAVGQPAYPTPSGLFHVQNKQVNPTWSVPNSPWAGELQGTTVEGGSAANPLKARWMGVTNGVGIHGTGEDYSIGTRASHGCIRMHVSDVIDLYPRVPVGTPVLLK